MHKRSPDSLRLVGTTVLLARTIEQERRDRSPQELDLNDLFVLRAIESGSELPSQIARKLRVDPPRITRVVDDLVKRGYVERQSDLEDRRRCPLRVTKAGKAETEKGLRALGEAAQRVLEPMEP